MTGFHSLIFNCFRHFLRRLDQLRLQLGDCFSFLLIRVGSVVWSVTWLAGRLVRELTVLIHAALFGELRWLQILNQAILNTAGISSSVDVDIVRSLSIWSKVEHPILPKRVLGCLILAVSLLTWWTICWDSGQIGHVNGGIHVLFRVMFESAFIRYHDRLHMRRWRAIDRMTWIETGKHIALSSSLIWVVEHPSFGLLFIHRRQLAVVYAGLYAV